MSTLQKAVLQGLRLMVDAIVLAVNVIACVLLSLLKNILPPSTPANIVGEIALVIGAAHGVGREIAHALAARGATVVCWDIDDLANQDTVHSIRANKGKAWGFAVDASCRDEVREAAAHIRRDVGEVTLLVNGAAAIAPRVPLLKQPHHLVERTVATNLMSFFWTIEAFLPDMMTKGRGYLATLSSCHALSAEPNMATYCATQSAVRGLMESLEAEIQQDSRRPKIKLTTIYPCKLLNKPPAKDYFSFLPTLSAQQLAEVFVDAILRGYRECCVPSVMLPIYHLQRLLPSRVMQLTNQFLHKAAEPIY